MTGPSHPPSEKADSAAPGLSGHGRKKADEEESLNADITYEVIRREGVQELERSTSALAWSGLGAGPAMGFSFVAMAALHAQVAAGEKD
jgi:hypothetical protein